MPHRLLFVHAHPDDESITTGATMARYAASGASVTLVTCTRGEQGEVIPGALRHLAGEALADHRSRELAAACEALGVADHRFLGAPDVRYVDSGMAYDHEGVVIPAPDPPPGAFALQDVEAQSAVLAVLVATLRPHVVVTYEPGGGYGHPDHVRAHEITMRAVELAATGDFGWTVAKVYWIVTPESVARAGLRAPGPPTGLDPEGRLPSQVVDDALVTTAVDAGAFVPAKRAALRAHETQVVLTDDGAHLALSNGLHQPVTGTEYYRLVRGTPALPHDAAGREQDLLAGIGKE